MHLIGKRRKFDGKLFTAKYSWVKKSNAEKMARRWRGLGFYVRVTRERMPSGGFEYYLWRRKK